MFSTFTASNFDKPLQTKRVKIELPTREEVAEEQTEHQLKVKSRSRFGCLTCRKKKKRCDERKPICGLCSKQHHACDWKIPGTERKNKRRRAGGEIHTPVQIAQSPELTGLQPAISTDADLDTASSLLAFSDQSALPKSPSIFLSLQEILNPRFEYTIESDDSSTPKDDETFLSRLTEFSPNLKSPRILHSPSNILTKDLDEQAINYLDYYRTCVATTVSIAPVESNYFLNFYLPLAAREKSVLFAIIGWGGTFMNGSKDNVGYSFYMKNSITLYKKKMASHTLNKNDILVLLTTLTILSAAEICVGDVRQWHVFFEEIYDLIESYGLQNLVKEFGQSNELRWLLLNFLYHDVLSSRSLKNGTFFKPIEYQRALQNDESSPVKNFTLKLTEADYGADPLQGCVKPLYMIIGEIINCSADLKKELTKLEETESRDVDELGLEAETDLSIANLNTIPLKQKRYEYYDKVESEFKRIEKQIINTKPNDTALSYLNNDAELELHLTLFEAYQLTLQLYLRMLVLKRPASSPDMQRLLYNLTNCTDILIGSKVQSSLCFPFLVAGLQCVSKSDKAIMLKRLDYMISFFPVMNFKLAKKILLEAWDVNDGGDRYVDWSDITDKLGWDLCVS